MKYLLLSFIFIFFVINLFAQNNPPVAVPDTATIMAEDTLAIQVLLNDYDPDGDAIFVKSAFGAQHGEEWDDNDSLVFYRSDYYSGLDSVRYRIKDDGSPLEYSEYAYIHLYVTENPNLPLAENDNEIVLNQFPVDINLLNNDTDPNGDEIQILEFYQAMHGNVSYVSDSLIQYKSQFYTGQDSFMYRVIEKNTISAYYSNWATVHLNIESNPNIPTTMNDSVSTLMFEPIEFNVLNNDTDPNGDLLAIYQIQQPQHGYAEIVNDTTLYYNSDLFTGVDSLKYRIIETNTSTNYYSDWATVYISVTSNPDIPIAVEDYATGLANEPIEINVLANDISPIGVPIEIFDAGGNNFLGSLSFNDSLITFTSFPFIQGLVTLEYRIHEQNNPTILSDWGNIYITVEENPALPSVNDDYGSTKAGIPISMNVIENDYNPTIDSIIIQSAEARFGLVEIIADSIIQYTSYYSFEGVDSILYAIKKVNEPMHYSAGYFVVDVESNHSYEVLDINNIHAGINSSGYLFNNIKEIQGIVKDNAPPAFEAPAGSGIHSIFASTFWIGGFDENNALHFAGGLFRQSGVDYWSGPYAELYDEGYDEKWAQLWKLNKDEIIYHKNHYTETGYQPIENILSWPGNGEADSGQAAQIAPYFDDNNNDIYEPMQGDYPLIRGDQAVFFVFNDDKSIHTETEGKKLGIEVHGMAYAFDNHEDSVLYNTIFVHYDIFNRSDTSYHNTYLGNFTDFDIGYSSDDYVGCDVQRGSYFGYNGTDYDPDDDETLGYHENPPAQGVTILGGAFMDDDGMDNPDGGCDFSVNGINFGNDSIDDERYGLSRFITFNNGGTAVGNPGNAIEYYNYMNGYWRDLTPIIYGARGHLNYGGLGPECNFMFPGASDSCNWGTSSQLPNGGYNQNGKFWTEDYEENNPGDRRGVGISGPFTFNPGDKQEFDLAFTFARDYANGDPLSLLGERTDIIMDQVEQNNLIALPEALDIHELNTSENKLYIYPNPVNSYLNIKYKAYSNSVDYSITNVSGLVVAEGQLSEGINHKIKTDQLAEGLYILNIKTNNKSYYNKFIKQ